MLRLSKVWFAPSPLQAVWRRQRPAGFRSDLFVKSAFMEQKPPEPKGIDACTACDYFSAPRWIILRLMALVMTKRYYRDIRPGSVAWCHLTGAMCQSSSAQEGRPDRIPKCRRRAVFSGCPSAYSDQHNSALSFAVSRSIFASSSTITPAT